MHKLTLLYAEDNQESRENYAFVLKDYFHEVYTAKDGREALDMYYEKKPDVLLLDVSMPKMDGLDVAAAIREEDEETPIIMLSAHSEREKLMRAVPLKLEKYLLKPINTKLLQTTMLNLINKLQYKDTVQLKEGLSWNKMNESLSYQKQQIKLTIKEKLLIELLSTTLGDYCIRNTLIYHVWHDEIPDASHDKKLTKLVSRLNKKIMIETDCTTALIENSYALGYRLAIAE
ncbi:response regulator transcription factor [Sulfurovum sp. CS9]|uniref:response regulator transcription factor n=1 Tax=Sulfurovum sp. CS9 TaxID=3391146 RepID=UPI0039EC24F1